MTFGAMAAWQGWLLVCAAAAVAAWLFFVKVRPPRVVVPTLLLWRRVLDEARELTLWERIRRAVSLVLTVAVAVALALAIARPSRPDGSAAASPGRLLIVLDSSWSMLTRTANGETRWERAVAEARRLAAASAGDEIALATTADGLIEGPTPDLALIDAGLDRIAPAGGDIGAWPRLADGGQVHFITDGGVARPFEPDTVVHSVFEAAPNVGITAFSVRNALEDSDSAPAGARPRDRAADAYLEIANFSPDAQRVRLVIARGDATIFDRPVDVGAGEALRQVVPLPSAGEPLLRARIDAPHNALSVDDEAYAWMGTMRPLSVEVVSQQPAWLAALFNEDPHVHASFVAPSAYQPSRADVVILDRWLPNELPDRPTLYVVGGDAASVVEKRPMWRQGGGHPILAGVDPRTFAIESVHQYRAPGLMPVAESEHGTPLVSIDQSGGRRLVAIAFGPQESNLASAPGFPVLIGNALEWLARPALAGVRRPGAVLFDESVLKVTGPTGKPVPLERVDRTVVGVLRQPGVYTAEGAGARSTIAVNVGDPQLSNTERTSLASDRSRPVTAGASPRPWWVYCALLALVLLVAEWWTWQRRITV